MIAQKLCDRYSETPYEVVSLEPKRELRYGENPHQEAALYAIDNSTSLGVTSAKVIQGKALSYNNILDADAAWKAVSDALLSVKQTKNTSSVCVVKHLNPCGIAVADDPHTALDLAWKGDSISAFGSIIAFTDEVDDTIAKWFEGKFIEVIIAPSFSQSALETFSSRKNLRLIELAPRASKTQEKVYRSVAGGMLVQNEDELGEENLISKTKIKLSNDQNNLALFGISVYKHLKSNAIALVTQTPEGHYWLTGAGMGQPNRLESLGRLAIPRFKQKDNCSLDQALLISDAFFPF